MVLSCCQVEELFVCKVSELRNEYIIIMLGINWQLLLVIQTRCIQHIVKGEKVSEHTSTLNVYECFVEVSQYLLRSDLLRMVRGHAKLACIVIAEGIDLP